MAVDAPSPDSLSSGFHFLLLTFPRGSLVEELGNHPWDWGIINSNLGMEKPLVTCFCPLPASQDWSSQFQHNGWAGRSLGSGHLSCTHQSKAEMKSCSHQDFV